MDVGFSLDDIFQFFTLKGGKVVYSEIVTHFKQALSNPATQAQARNLFKDHVNTLATVTNENGTKYLVLRPKYMRNLLASEESNDSVISNASANVPTVPCVPSAPIVPCVQQEVTPREQQNGGNGHDASPHISRPYPIITSDSRNCSSNLATSNHTFPGDSLERNVSSSVVTSTNNVGDNINNSVLAADDSDIPPRPPPRKKGSFSKTKSPPVPVASMENQENDNQSSQAAVETNQEVKKEIQELARTPGRVKEHAQILNKLALSAECKLPMPTTTTTNNSVHTQVVNKIRNGFHGNDSDSGSIQISDSLKKKWIVAASNCDHTELCCLLKEDSNLGSYCDFITGFNALHWAAKFNKPNIIKLLAGRYGVDPNCRSFSGSTPLHLAAQFKHESIVKLLIDIYGANKEIRDNYGKKALQYLESNEKKPNERNTDNSAKSSSEKNNVPPNNANVNNCATPTENPPKTIMNLRNKLSHQSMLVRNKFRQSKAFQKRKASFSSK